MTGFLENSAPLDTQWRSIILLGNNVASYKFSLGTALLKLGTEKSTISLEELSLPFAQTICNHLKTHEKQITSTSSKFLDACRKFNNEELTLDQLKEETLKRGFANVIDAFHNVHRSEVSRFFTDTRKENQSITLTDNLFHLIQSDQHQNLIREVGSRWNLWETAISIGISPHLLEIQHDPASELFYIIKDNIERVDVTSCKDSLNGYQKGKCFYCDRYITILNGNEFSCDVDHFFPHVLSNFGFKGINQIWNLVLACQNCNRGVGGKFEQLPHISFLTKLNNRNNFYIESHHPLRETIINQTGSNPEQRRSFLQKRYDEALSIFPGKEKWTPKEQMHKHE